MRAVQLCFATTQGGRTLVRIAVGRIVPQLGIDVEIKTRSGPRVMAPASQWCWFPIVEVLIDDCYHLAELAADLQMDTPIVVDIGAHVGAFSVGCALSVPTAKVIAYEPSVQRCEYLRRNVEVNGLAGRVSVVRAAVTGSSGMAELTSTGVVQAVSAGDSGERVATVSLDEIIQQVGNRVDLLKMDSEGSEYDIVFSAAPASLAAVQAVVLETHPAPADARVRLFETLRQSGPSERWRQGDSSVTVSYLTRS